MNSHLLRLGDLEAEVSALGAELRALRHEGRDLLWDGGPLWPRRAPLLFPIVGCLKGDTLRLGERIFSLPKHGFARDRAFAWTERTATACALELADDAGTRAAYPFPFRLRVRHALEGPSLRTELTLANPGPELLPASLGGHPAFRWPLVPGLPKATHRVVFEQPEPESIRRLTAEGLIDPEPRPTPVEGRKLALREELFEAEGGPGLAFSWEGFPHFGIWTKPDPGPSFLCLEPWQGFASPADWDGDFADKPGAVVLAPGEIRAWSYTVTPG